MKIKISPRRMKFGHSATEVGLASKMPRPPRRQEKKKTATPVSNTPEVYWESNPERCPVCKVWDECYCAENRELSLYCLTCGEDIIDGICACGDLPGSHAPVGRPASPEPKADPYADMSDEELEADLRRKLGMDTTGPDDWTRSVKHIFSGSRSVK